MSSSGAVAAGPHDARSRTTPARTVPRPDSRSGGGGRGRPPARDPWRIAPSAHARSLRLGLWPRKSGASAEPASRPRRRGAPEYSELTRRARRPELPPEAPAASATRGGAGGCAASARRGPGARARGRARAAPPRAGRSPLERLPAWQRFWQEGGRDPGGRRRGGRERGGGKRGEGGPAAPHPRLSITPQIKCPRGAPGRGMDRPTKEPLLRFSDQRRGALLKPPGPPRLELCPVPAASTGGCGSDAVK